MATLTEAAYYTRKGIKYGSVGLVFIVILRIVFGFAVTWWKETHPPPPPPASVAFDKLPKLPFDNEEHPGLQLRLETVSGTTGDFDNLGMVFFMPEKKSNLLALDRASDLARRIDFLFEPKKIGETTYEWSKDNPFPATLKINTVSEHFSLNADWEARPDLLISTPGAPSEAEAITIGRSWLSALKLLGDDLKSGEAKVNYLMVSGTEVIPALSRSEAQFVEVNLYRNSLDGTKIWTKNPEKGLVSLTFLPTSLRGGRTNVIKAEYNYNPIEYAYNATYPLITSQEAWNRLVKGEGYYASVPEKIYDVAVRRVSLGFFDPPEPNYFLQPIYVFEGDNDFVGYVQAVSDDWLITE